MERSEILEEWQTWLADQGIPSFPLFGIMNGACRCRDGAECKNPGKHPKIKGWRDLTSPHPVGVLDNLGISTDRLVVVDFDATRERPEELPDTFTVHTARGMHLWYWANPVHPIRNKVAWRPKVDIRSVGGLVAAPPSRTVAGGEYAYVSGEIQPVPNLVLETQHVYVHRERKAQITEVPDSTEEFIQPLITGLAAEVEHAPSGERNHTLFRCLCRFFELAESGWAGEDALREIVSAAKRSGLGSQEILATVDSASRSLTQ